MKEKTLKKYDATALPEGEPIDYALAWGVSLNRAQVVLRRLWRLKLMTRTRKHGNAPRIYRRAEA